MEKIRALEAHHHLVISSLLIFGIIVVWVWGSVVWGVSNGTNVTVNVGPPDACPNISGYQETVPSGMLVDQNGACYTPPPPAVDVCPTIDGMQTSIPDGYYMNDGGDCELQPAPPAQPIDVCPNLDGVQSDVPDGYYNLTDGRCVRPPSDLCDNIDGSQYLVPEGMLRADGGLVKQAPFRHRQYRCSTTPGLHRQCRVNRRRIAVVRRSFVTFLRCCKVQSSHLSTWSRRPSRRHSVHSRQLLHGRFPIWSSLFLG
jgi:hypothetical protein